MLSVVSSVAQGILQNSLSEGSLSFPKNLKFLARNCFQEFGDGSSCHSSTSCPLPLQGSCVLFLFFLFVCFFVSPLVVIDKAECSVVPVVSVVCGHFFISSF